MAIPLRYNLRNLRVRWRSTLATVLGIALVVTVFVMVMALARGLKATYISTGDERNLLALRQGSTSESSSQITREAFRRMRYLDGIARNERGDPLISAEIIVLIYLDRRDGNGGANVLVRGLGPVGRQLRPSISLAEGRWFQPGLHECVVSRRIAQRFAGCQLGESFRAGKFHWTVVGIFDAAKTAYESEIWVDADEAREAFNRDFYGSILFRPAEPEAPALLRRREELARELKSLPEAPATPNGNGQPASADDVGDPAAVLRAERAAVEQSLRRLASVGRIESDRQLKLRLLPETEYYREQTKQAAPIQFIGSFLATIMSIGAAFAAMNTMYAAVGARTRELGTLRVLGFQRRHIYAAILLESVLLALLGGVLGCLIALPLNGLATGTFSWTTFAEVAFEFRITGELLARGMLFALVMGILGGLLPARLAARKSLLDALRAV